MLSTCEHTHTCKLLLLLLLLPPLLPPLSLLLLQLLLLRLLPLLLLRLLPLLLLRLRLLLLPPPTTDYQLPPCVFPCAVRVPCVPCCACPHARCATDRTCPPSIGRRRPPVTGAPAESVPVARLPVSSKFPRVNARIHSRNAYLRAFVSLPRQSVRPTCVPAWPPPAAACCLLCCRGLVVSGTRASRPGKLSCQRCRGCASKRSAPHAVQPHCSTKWLLKRVENWLQRPQLRLRILSVRTLSSEHRRCVATTKVIEPEWLTSFHFKRLATVVHRFKGHYYHWFAEELPR